MTKNPFVNHNNIEQTLSLLKYVGDRRWGNLADVEALQHLVQNLEFVQNVDYNADNGDITFTFPDHSTLSVNVFVENLAQSIDYDSSTKELVITQKDGTELRVDVSDLVDVYLGSNGTLI